MAAECGGEAEEDCGGVGASSPRPPTRRPPRCASASPADPRRPARRRRLRRAAGDGDGEGCASSAIDLGGEVSGAVFALLLLGLLVVVVARELFKNLGIKIRPNSSEFLGI